MILACFILHNCLMPMGSDEDLIVEIDAELTRQEVTYDEYCIHRSNNDNDARGEHLRD